MRIAVAQFAPYLGDKEANLELITNYLHQAKDQQAELVMFPELALTGYSIGDQLETLAEEADSPSLQMLARVCKQLGLFALVSFPERNGSQYHISSVLLQDDGTIAGVYRKTHLFAPEKEFFTSGDQWPVFHTRLGAFGVMICYDLEFPEVARLLRLNGAELLLVNTANFSPYEKHQYVYMQSRAMENEVPVVICNRLGTEGDLHFFGHSMAVRHDGNVLGHFGSSEGLYMVDVTLANVPNPQLDYLSNMHPSVRSRLLNCRNET